MENSVLKKVGDDGTGPDHTPRLDSEPWELSLSGETERAKERPLSLNQLLRLEAEPYEQPQRVECVSAGDMTLGKASVRFGGARFSTLARYMGIDPDPESWEEEMPTVIFRSAARAFGGPARHHTTSLPLRDCLDPAYEVMLATHLEGEPLPYEHGGPLRLVVGPELFFYKALKWLAEIEIVHEPLDLHPGTWEKYAGYHKRGRVRYDERFTPMLREIVNVYEGARSFLVDVTEEIPEDSYSSVLAEAIKARDFSHLIAARLHEIDRPLWRSIPHKDLTDFTFKKRNFHAKLRGTSFAGFSFFGCDLSNCNFSLSIFSAAKFSRPDGSEAANLEGCDLEGANFRNAHLRNVSLQGAILANVEFFDPAKVDQSTNRVEGLDVRNAQKLDPNTKSWLKRNGAIAS